MDRVSECAGEHQVVSRIDVKVGLNGEKRQADQRDDDGDDRPGVRPVFQEKYGKNWDEDYEEAGDKPGVPGGRIFEPEGLEGVGAVEKNPEK